MFLLVWGRYVLFLVALGWYVIVCSFKLLCCTNAYWVALLAWL